MSDDDEVENTPDLSISSEKVCYLILKARKFDAKDVVTDPDDASNPTDDGMVSVLEDHRDDPVVQEIAAAIFAMTEDEQVDLVTLAWGAATARSKIGANCALKHSALTISAPPHICSACRCWRITSKIPWRNSDTRATSDGAADRICARNLIFCFFSPNCRQSRPARSLLGTENSTGVPSEPLLALCRWLVWHFENRRLKL